MGFCKIVFTILSWNTGQGVYKKWAPVAAPFGIDLTPNTDDKRQSIYQQESIQDNIKQASPIKKFRNLLKKRNKRHKDYEKNL